MYQLFLYLLCMIPNKVVNTIGVMPTNVFPATTTANMNKMFMYYREDGDLRLFDVSQQFEFNLFTMIAVEGDLVINIVKN